jgi:hypothetical protein
MVGVKAGVLGVSRDLGFGPTANKKEWLSVHCTNAGAVQAYRNGERVGLRSEAMVTARHNLPDGLQLPDDFDLALSAPRLHAGTAAA